MIRLLRVEARDIHVVMDVPVSFIEKLLTVLDMCEFKYDSTNPDHVELKQFLTQELYPSFDQILKGIEENGS